MLTLEGKYTRNSHNAYEKNTQIFEHAVDGRHSFPDNAVPERIGGASHG